MRYAAATRAATLRYYVDAIIARALLYEVTRLHVADVDSAGYDMMRVMLPRFLC